MLQNPENFKVMTRLVRIYLYSLRRMCVMYEDLKKENIIVELKSLIDKAEEFKSDIDCYCEFMRETFLATSGLN